MKKILLILLAFSFVPEILFAAEGVCMIQNEPPKALSDYLKSVDAELNTIRKSTKNNACNGLFSNEKKFLESMDRIDIRNELDTNFVGDFRYNIETAFKGVSRSQVVRQGMIIRDKEKVITSTLRTVANTCNLDTPVADMENQTAESILAEMLARNRRIEKYFKSAAVGEIQLPDGTNELDRPIYEAIASSYTPSMTSGCKNQYEFEEITAKFQEAVDFNFTKIGNSFDSWKKAIAIFRGNISQSEEQEMKTRLLRQELGKQGMSQAAQSTMLKNLSCFQRDTSKESTMEELAKTRQECTQSIIQGLDNITKPLETAFLKATNTDEYIQKLVTIDKEKNINQNTVPDMWMNLNVVLANNAETSTNDQMLSDLVNIHLELVQTNTLLKKKIPDIQKNCMKANPGIVGGCRVDE